MYRQRLSRLAQLVRVCTLPKLPPGMMKGVEVDKRRVLVDNLDGALYALDGTCTHKEAELSTGFLLGNA